MKLIFDITHMLHGHCYVCYENMETIPNKIVFIGRYDELNGALMGMSHKKVSGQINIEHLNNTRWYIYYTRKEEQVIFKLEYNDILEHLLMETI